MPARRPGPYLLGYSGGQQRRWLERTLQRANFDPTVDWIIAYFHQPAMSTSTTGSGSDMGIRQTWLPLFYEYGVDLVLCGHDHDYERSYAVRGVDQEATLRPAVVSMEADEVDTSQGLVHIVLGGGGTSSHDDFYEGTDSAYGPYTSEKRPHLPGLQRPGDVQAGGADLGRGQLVGRARPEHDLPVGHRRLRPGPRPVPWRPYVDHDDLLPHAGRDDIGPEPGADRVRHVHRRPAAPGRLSRSPGRGGPEGTRLACWPWPPPFPGRPRPFPGAATIPGGAMLPAS
jgi:3',5'-cyclic AMP phosphodiesterase CpdA